MPAIITDDSQPQAPTYVGSPLVSVVIEAYNHRDYIERCLRGIAMQQVDFAYEVLVGEDCSPDGTARVLRDLACDFPDNFTFILRDKNLGGSGNGQDLWRRVRGRYCAFVEGDDFWTDPEKLRKQVDYLQANPDCSGVYAKVQVVGEDSLPNGERYPECPLADYTYREFFYSALPGHWSTLMVRWPEFYSHYLDFCHMKTYGSYPGDRRNAFILLSIGRIHCLPDVTGAYRHVKHKGTSYSARTRFDEAYAENEVRYGRSLVEYSRAHGSPEAMETARRTCYRFLLKWSVGKVKVRKLGETLKEILHQPRWYAYLFAPIQWYTVLALRMLRGRPIDL